LKDLHRFRCQHKQIQEIGNYVILSFHISKKNFHKIENINPCNPFANILVLRPLPNSPNIPSAATTSLAASKYLIRVSFTWRYVLTTRRELETVSDITDAQNPIKA